MKDKFTLKPLEELTFIPTSDWHLGTKITNEKWLDHFVDYVCSLDGIVIIDILGDLVDCAKLRRGNSAYNAILTVNEQIQGVRKRLRKFINTPNIYIRICVPGNHDAGFRIEDFDLMQEICESLNLEYTGSYTSISKKGDIVEYIQGADFVDKIWINNKPLKIYLRHGHGKAKRLDLAMAKTLRETQKKEADIYCEGHNHRCHSWPEAVKTSIDEGKIKKRWYCYTGHFLSYPGSYAEDMGLDPLPEAFIEFKIKDNGEKLVINPIEHHIDEERPDLWKV